jgi:hypothetical protein
VSPKLYFLEQLILVNLTITTHVFNQISLDGILLIVVYYLSRAKEFQSYAFLITPIILIVQKLAPICANLILRLFR